MHIHHQLIKKVIYCLNYDVVPPTPCKYQMNKLGFVKRNNLNDNTYRTGLDKNGQKELNKCVKITLQKILKH